MGSRTHPTKAELNGMKSRGEKNSKLANKQRLKYFSQKAELEAVRPEAKFTFRTETKQILIIRKEDIKNASSEDFLIDHFSIGVLMDARIEWEALSTRCRGALAKAVQYRGKSKLLQKSNFSLTDINSLQLGDFRDQINVGIKTLINLIYELQELSALGESIEKSNVGCLSMENFDLENKSDIYLKKIRSDISNAETITLLQEAMLKYLSEVTVVQKRDIDIWRVRLPWLTTSPETLASIGNRYGLTRERIRQIIHKVDQFPFLLNEPVRVLQSIQNAILENDSCQDFIDELVDCEIISTRDFRIGIFRQLAVALSQEEAVSDLERAIYEWSQSSLVLDSPLK